MPVHASDGEKYVIRITICFMDKINGANGFHPRVMYRSFGKQYIYFFKLAVQAFQHMSKYRP